MNIKKNLKIVSVKSNEAIRVWVLGPSRKCYIPIDEAFLRHQIPDYTRLNEKTRNKEKSCFLKACEEIGRIQIPDYLPNAHRKIKGTQEQKRKVCTDDLRQGALILLSVCQLFKVSAVGILLVANILAGLRCSALRRAGFEGRMILSVNAGGSELLTAFTALVCAAVPRKRWKASNWSLRRSAVLDYADTSDGLPRHIQDYNEVRIHVKGAKSLRFPSDYQDSLVLINKADGSQLREALPHMENTAVFLLNCSSPDGGSQRIPAASCSHLDPTIISQLNEKRTYVAAVLRWWWSEAAADENWGQGILRRVHSSFSNSDDRFISVVIDPQKMQRAILHGVLCSFMDELEHSAILSGVELAPHRSIVQETFEPQPEAPVPVHRADDPEVFLAVMRELVREHANKILPSTERFVKADKPFAAWRTISGEEHLVIPETVWASAYKKTIHKGKEIDGSLFDRENWQRDFQRIFCEANVIKAPAAGYRYRYDFFENGSRDTTYVIAIPSKLLKD